VRDCVISLEDQQKLRLKDSVDDLKRLPEWPELTQEERGNSVAGLEALALTVSQDLSGLKKLLARDYDISSTIDDLKRRIHRQREERRRQELNEEAATFTGQDAGKLSKSIPMPTRMTSVEELDRLILKLNELRAQLALYTEIEVSFVIGGDV